MRKKVAQPVRAGIAIKEIPYLAAAGVRAAAERRSAELGIAFFNASSIRTARRLLRLPVTMHSTGLTSEENSGQIKRFNHFMKTID